MNFKKVLVASLASMAIIACSDDDDSGSDAAPTNNLVTNISGLEDLGAGFAYEGWIMVDGTPISTGVFTVDANGDASQTAFTVDADDLAAATKYILTIEPSPDPNPAPSDQKLIAGDFSGNTASANVEVAPAFADGFDFTTAAGNYFLRTPTDEASPGNPNNMNDQFGVWFGNPGMPPTAAFTLPTLPTGWAYEGWVVTSAGPISTGTFTDFGAVDASNMFSGTAYNVGPPIPGEDFFNNAPAGQTFPLDVRGNMVVISIEPVPDNDPAPFLLKPLAAMVDMNAGLAPTSHAFGQNLGTLPTAVITRN